MDIVSFNEAATANARIEKFIKDPDSNSGIVTVPKIIGIGESVTVPAGRVAVLPNVQIDGEIIVEGDGEIFIPAGATLSKVVELEGDQTISDVKTFLESPIVPTATAGNQAVNLETANSYDLGVGQTWQDVKASRSLGVTYTNNTGKPIFVSVNFDATVANSTFAIIVNGIYVNIVTISNTNGDSSVSAIVPHLSTYRVVQSYLTGGSVTSWNELR